MIKSEITLSIVIPVYNVEPYLEQCLKSVLCCDLTACEIILSLGISADRSSEICFAYARENPSIHTLHQNGTGLSNARNCAMDVAQGEYLMFLDSDDYVDSRRLDSLISQIRDTCFSADVIATDFYRQDRRTGRITPIFQIGADAPAQYGMDFLPSMLRKRQCFWNVWRYVYRRIFLEQHGIRFMENSLSEDIDFTTSVFLAEPEIVFSHSPYYIYTVGRGESLMDCPNCKRLTDTVFVLKDAIRRLRVSSFPYAQLLIAQFQFEYILNLALTVEIVPRDRTAARALYADWRQVVSGSPDQAVRCVSRIITITGLRLAAYGLHFLKQLRRWLRKHPVKEESRNDYH